MKIKPIKTRVFQEGEDLFDFVCSYFKNIPEKSVIVITSKIVALAEKRTAEPKDKERILKEESELAVKTKYMWLTIKDGNFTANAGIDSSNGNGKIILWPKDSFKTAKEIREKLRKKYKLKKLGVLITDSRVMPLRSGTLGLAIGWAGFAGIKNYKGKEDIFGRKFKHSKINIPDNLASAVILTMGEGDERQPLTIIENAPIEFRDKVRRNEIKIKLENDIYLPLYKSVFK